MILAAYRLEPIGSVEVCLWYMLGVVLYAGVRLLTWVRTPAVDRIPLGQCLAAKGQAIILGFAFAWLWVGGRLWEFLELTRERFPEIPEIPVFAPDQLSSIMVGFVLQWAIVQRVVNKFGYKPKKENNR